MSAPTSDLDAVAPPSASPPAPRRPASSSSRATRPEDRIGFWEKAALGLGSLPLFFGTAAVKGLTIPVYQMTLKLSPVLVGTALAIPSFWDAAVDLFVGYKSDNCHSRFGRRRPFIAVGSIACMLAFGLIWMVPSGMSSTATLAYLLGTLLLFFTCFSFFSVPLTTLAYEMTPDYQERTRVAAFGGFFGKAGEFIYQWIFPLACSAALFGTVMHGVRVVGWGIAVLVMGVMGLVPALFVKERYFKRAVHQEKVRFLPSLRDSFRNRAFVILVALTLCHIVAGMFISSIDYYLLVYHMSGGNVAVGSYWKAILSSAYAIIGIVGIYPVNWMANRIGKRTTLIVTFAMVLVGAAGKWFLFTPGNPWKILLDPLLCGPVWIAINVLTPSMFADVCDLDELTHGQRREGMFGSLFSWIQKSGYSLAYFGTGLALSLSGFNAGLAGHQHASAILSLRLIFTGTTALWALGAIALLCLYPLTKDRAYEIRDELEARRGRI
ncbi:glucuronide carrier protein [mine drainage metagenome]|uniref:Glucuronide carrier protein n=1 Tax=mine drainage metagenome TaxID=410659 RepID=A0A1J5TRH8_9ZZZZ